MVTLSVLFPGCLAARESKREVFLTNYRPSIGVITFNSTHLIIPLPSISLPPLIPPLTSGYLTAKTNCLTEGIHNSSYTLWIYKSPVLPCKYGKSMLTVWCQYRFLLAGKKEKLFQLLHEYYIYINVVLSHFCSQHMLNTCAFWG